MMHTPKCLMPSAKTACDRNKQLSRCSAQTLELHLYVRIYAICDPWRVLLATQLSWQQLCCFGQLDLVVGCWVLAAKLFQGRIGYLHD